MENGPQETAEGAEHADRIIEIYRRHARAWAQRRGVVPVEGKWLDRFLALLPNGSAIQDAAGRRPVDREPAGLVPAVLDLGCGSGAPVGTYLLARGCAVTGIDAAPELIAIARARAPAACWAVADMRGLALGRTFQGLLAWNSSFHLTPTAQRAMFATYQRHAAPGAALMFTSGTQNGCVLGTFEGERLYHASLGPDEYTDLLERHGFAVVDHCPDDPDCGGQTVWLARYRGPQG